MGKVVLTDDSNRGGSGVRDDKKVVLIDDTDPITPYRGDPVPPGAAIPPRKTYTPASVPRTGAQGTPTASKLSVSKPFASAPRTGAPDANKSGADARDTVVARTNVTDSVVSYTSMPSKGRKKVILAVDDSDTVLTSIRGMLSDTYEILTAADARKADGCLKINSIDLMLLDIDMPGLDGISYMRKLKKDSKNKFPVVFLSSNSGSDNVIKTAHLGAMGFIEKPFDKAKLLSKIEAWLT